MSNRSSKLKYELLLPGEHAWELWTGTNVGPMQRARIFGTGGAGGFETANAQHVLALPAASVWVLPAWLQGQREHLNEVAQLHLERLGVRTPGHSEAMLVDTLSTGDGSHLARIVALKDVDTPLAHHRLLPDECRLNAACVALPTDAIIIWRELGRFVVAITIGSQLAYFSPLSSASLDQNGLAELNNICLQLSFQRILSSLTTIVLWTEEGDAQRMARVTGLEVVRQEKPAPQVPSSGRSKLMPADILASRASAKQSERRRLLLLSAGFVMAAVVAGFSFLMAEATRERDALREKVAEVTPRAAKILAQQAAWQEIAPAVDPNFFPMELLLRTMEPESSAEIGLTSFECTAKSVVIQGRAPEISPALKFTEDIKSSELLMAYQWEASTPKIESDNSASFELKGTLPEAAP